MRQFSPLLVLPLPRLLVCLLWLCPALIHYSQTQACMPHQAAALSALLGDPMHGGGDVPGVEAYLGDGVTSVTSGGDAEVGWVDWAWGVGGDVEGVDAEEEGAEEVQVRCDGDGMVWCEASEGERDVEGVDAEGEGAEAVQVGCDGDAMVLCEGSEGEGDAEDAGDMGDSKDSGSQDAETSGNAKGKGKASRDPRPGGDETRQSPTLPATGPGVPLPLQPTQAGTLTIMTCPTESQDDSNTAAVSRPCACRRQLHHLCKATRTQCLGSVGKDGSRCEPCAVSYHPPVFRAAYLRAS